jgi:glycosyltransferase involved in cell wall biosynthesis
VGPAWSRRFSLVDICILYTEAARKDAEALGAASLLSDPTYRPPVFHVVGHGVDCTSFIPLPNARHGEYKKGILRQLFPEDWRRLDECFIVLNANRPYWRKRLDLTIDGFAEFAKLRPNARLVLHTGVRTEAMDSELCGRIGALDIEEKVVFSPRCRDGAPLCIERLNKLYNLCDVGLNTAMGEGWGLASFEHASAGAAQIVPAHPSILENWTDSAWPLACEDILLVPFEATEMAPTTPREISGALTEMYEKPDLRTALADAGRARAREERFKWDTVERKFLRILQDAFPSRSSA